MQLHIIYFTDFDGIGLPAVDTGSLHMCITRVDQTLKHLMLREKCWSWSLQNVLFILKVVVVL